MRRRFKLMLVAAVGLTLSAGLSACQGCATHCDPVNQALPAAPGRYLGVFEQKSNLSVASVQEFATAIGRWPNILLSYSSWFERFQPGFAARAAAHGAIPMVQLQPLGISLAGIAAGRYDSYLRSYAAQVRAYRDPVILSFAHEMNGSWYSWGFPQVPPAIWVAAWRHVVDLFRADGASNVTWLWAPNVSEPGSPPLRDYWPGRSFVNWIGLDGYLETPAETFANVFGPSIVAIRSFTDQPILLAETAVGPAAGQVAKIPGIFSGVEADKLLGLVWFDVAQNGNINRQDWRLEDDPDGLAEFRKEVRLNMKLAAPG
jgi:mannan endo-1,4-beta-mannosidase